MKTLRTKLFWIIIGASMSLSTAASMEQGLQNRSLSLPTLNQSAAINKMPAAPKNAKVKPHRGKSGSAPFLANQTNSEILSSFKNGWGRNTVTATKPKPPIITPVQQAALVQLSNQSQRPAVIRSLFDKTTGVPGFLKIDYAPSTQPDTAARVDGLEVAKNFIKNNKALFKLTSLEDELVPVGSKTDKLGLSHFKFVQSYDGIPVFGKELLVHTDQSAGVYLANGRTLPTPEKVDTTPTISESDALDAARKHLQITKEERSKASLVLRENTNGGLDLAYLIDISPSVSDRWLYFIDAMSGKIIHQIHNIHKAGTVVSASGMDLLGQTRNFNAWSENSAFYAVDPSFPLADANYNPLVDGPNIKGDTFIIDFENSEGDIYSFPSSISQNSSWDATAVSALHNTNVVYDYYLNTHSRDGIDDKNMNLLIGVHYSTNLNNAFWNGAMMIYGDGDNNFFGPLAKCLDVAAHEMTHGVIENSAGLIYENQSGALNESFADVFGAMVDSDNWTMGEDCTIPAPGFLRNLADPSNAVSQQPTKMSEYVNLPNTPDGDNGGVHANSGIPNRAAYLLAEGLTAEALGTSIGRTKTEKIYYRALTLYMTASSQFIDARRALTQAAEDLYGTGSAEVTAVGLSWDTVEVIEGTNASPSDTKPSATDAVSGNDTMVYLYPQDGSHDNSAELFDVYRQVMDSPFSGYNAANDFGPLNIGIAAAYTKPASYTDNDGTVVLFVGVDNNLYGVANVVNPTALDVVQITTTGDIYSIALSPNGRYVVFTSTDANDNTIHVLDLVASTSFDIPILPKSYQEDGQSVNTIFFADSLAFDYSSNVLAFDALFCQSTPNSACSLGGGGYQYWSIGFLEIDTQNFYYPLPDQTPDFDVGFPAFAANNNYVIAFDVNQYTDTGVISAVLAGDLEAQVATSIFNFGEDVAPVHTVPSFWGDDNYVTGQSSTGDASVVSAYRVPIDTSWTGNQAAAEQLNAYAVAMPIMHREGIRMLTGSLTPSTGLLDFGVVPVGSTKSINLTLSNNGNSDVDISSISLSGSAYTHNATNVRVPRQDAITVKVAYSPVTSGSQTGSLTFNYNGEASVTVSLTGVDAVSPPPPTDDNNTTTTSTGGGGGTLNIFQLFLVLSLLVVARRMDR